MPNMKASPYSCETEYFAHAYSIHSRCMHFAEIKGHPSPQTSCIYVHTKGLPTSGAMKAIVPSSCPWNSPAPVCLDANLADAPKSPIRTRLPVLSIRRLAPETGQGELVNSK